MNVLQRAIRYCLRKKIRSIILILVFTLLAAAAIIAVSIGNASQQATTDVKETVGGSIHIDLDDSRENYGSGTQNQWGTTYQYIGDYITEDVIRAVSKADGVVSYNAQMEGGYWGAAVDFEYFPGSFNLSYTDYGEESPFDISLNTALDKKFLNGTYTLEEGRHITADDSYAVLISKELADRNGLSVGDSITMYSLDVDAKDTFEIVGIFSGTEGTTKEAITLDEIPANQGYMDLNSYNEIFGTSIRFGSLDVYVDTAENAQNVLDSIQKLPELKDKTFTYEINSESFDLISNPLSSLQKMVNTTIRALVLISAAIVAILLMLWTRSRRREIGILLAIGKNKWEIVGQLLTENLLLAVVSFAASGGVAFLLAERVGDFFVSKAASDVSDLAIRVKVSDMAAVFGAGMFLIGIGVLAASYTIIRLKPRDILEKMS